MLFSIWFFGYTPFANSRGIFTFHVKQKQGFLKALLFVSVRNLPFWNCDRIKANILEIQAWKVSKPDKGNILKISSVCSIRWKNFITAIQGALEILLQHIDIHFWKLNTVLPAYCIKKPISYGVFFFSQNKIDYEKVIIGLCWWKTF